MSKHKYKIVDLRKPEVSKSSLKNLKNYTKDVNRVI